MTANRTVSVTLRAQIADYVAKIGESRKATSELDQKIEDLGKSSTAMSRDIERGAGVASRSMVAAGMAAGRAADQVDELGDQMGETAIEAGFLDRRIAELRGHIVELGHEYDRTGSADVFAPLRKDRGELSKLMKMRRELDAIADVGESLGDTVGKGGLSGIGEMLGALPAQAKGAGMAIGVALAAGAAPLIGAAIAGAVVGGVGIGGLAGGIAAAASDPAVKAAAADFAGQMQNEFADAGEAFVGPVQDALRTLSFGVHDLKLDELLAPLAPHLAEAAEGLIDFAKAALPGFTRAINAAGPAIDAIVEELPALGRAFGDMVGDISESEGAVEGLRYTLELVTLGVQTAGGVITALSDAFHWIATTGMDVVSVGADIADVLTAIIFPASLLVDTPWDWVGRAADDMSDMATGAGKVAAMVPGSAAALDEMGSAAERAGQKSSFAALDIDEMNESINRSLGLALSMTEASIAWEAGIDRLTQSVEDNGTTLDITTEKGRANAEAITGLVSAAQRQRQITEEVTGSTAQANAEYQRAIEKIIALGKNAGLSAAEIKKLVGDYKINVSYTTTYHTIIDAPSVKGDPLGYASYFAGQSIPGRAVGGPVMAGQPYVVGEHRPELFVPATNGTILSSVPATRSGGGDGGERLIRVIVQDTSGRVLRNELIRDGMDRGLPPDTVRAAYP